MVPALLTAIALAPPTRPRRLAIATYMISMAIIELPHLFALLVIGSTWLSLVDGAPPPGEATIVLTATALILAGLTVVAVRGIRAPRSVDRGLTAAGIPEAQHHRPWWLVAVTPFPVRPRRIQRIANLSYGDHPKQRLDLYRRRDHRGPSPVLVYLHGGGYVSGNKHWEGRPLINHLADRGWVCLSASYRLRPEADFEDHLADARAVLAWARRHAAEHGGDPDTVVMAGSSAGAHLTAICAMTQDRAEPESDNPSSAVVAGICMYGYYGRYYGRGPSEPTPSTPLALDPAKAPPMLLSHGTLDTYTSVEDARALADRLRSGSRNPVVYAELPGGQHGFDLFRSWRMQAVLDGVDAFVDRLGLGAPSVARDSRAES